MTIPQMNYHPSVNLIQISQDGQIVFVRRDQATAFMSAFMRALNSASGELVDSEPVGPPEPEAAYPRADAEITVLHPGYSVKA